MRRYQPCVRRWAGETFKAPGGSRTYSDLWRCEPVPVSTEQITPALAVFFYGFLSERKFSIHKVSLEMYMSKLCVYFPIGPSAGLLIQPAIM